jgi:hypothetical protein
MTNAMTIRALTVVLALGLWMDAPTNASDSGGGNLTVLDILKMDSENGDRQL